MNLKQSIQEPIPELWIAADLLNAAVKHHLKGHITIAAELFAAADLSVIQDWTSSFWDRRWRATVEPNVNKLPTALEKSERHAVRMPSKQDRNQLLARDGHNCRYCGLPVISEAVRNKARTLYPDVVRWGRKSIDQHAAFQALWLQFDHIVPHSRGGDNSVENIVVSCAACNFGKGNFLLEELNLHDPRDRQPERSAWSGLEELLL